MRGDRQGGGGGEDPDKENRSSGLGQPPAPDPTTDPADPAVVYEVTSADGFKFRSPDIAEVRPADIRTRAGRC